MSLATRCTSCGTVFRVVQDQLKVSEGWVRCGRCDEVFNALEGLFDLEREPVPAGPLSAASSAQKPGSGPGASGGGHEDSFWPQSSAAERWEPSLAERLGAELLATRPGQLAPPSVPTKANRRDPVEYSNAKWDAELLTDVAAQETQVVAYSLDEPPFEAIERSESEGAQRAPEFLRHAERQASWQRPGVRVLLSLVFLLLSGALALQAAHHFRDTVAAKWPQTRPALLAWCGAIKCTLELPRRIEDVSVESTTLARVNANSEAYRLSVNLRNRGTLPLGVPSVDLKLTDGSGALISRRMLSPRDFGTTAAALQPGSETTLQLLLSTGTLGIIGYTVEVFYP